MQWKEGRWLVLHRTSCLFTITSFSCDKTITVHGPGKVQLPVHHSYWPVPGFVSSPSHLSEWPLSLSPAHITQLIPYPTHLTQPWRWRQPVHLQQWYPFRRVHGVTVWIVKPSEYCNFLTFHIVFSSYRWNQENAVLCGHVARIRKRRCEWRYRAPLRCLLPSPILQSIQQCWNFTTR
jgi:hypothetical protein